MNAKQRIVALLQTMKLEVRITSPRVREDLRLVEFLKMHRIETILDVGANHGGFANMIFKAGFKGKIFSFEPLPVAHANISRQAEKNPNWIIADRTALSDSLGKAEFKVTAGDASSSLLTPSSDFVNNASVVTVVDTVEVKTSRLDDAIGAYGVDLSRAILKVDVQGGESKVFAGAEETLKTLGGVLCEVSFLPLYDGQVLWDDIHELISSNGLSLWDVWPGFRFPKSLRLSQMDLVYFRKSDGDL